MGKTPPSSPSPRDAGEARMEDALSAPDDGANEQDALLLAGADDGKLQSMPTVDPTRYDWDYGQHMQSMNERQQIPREEGADDGKLQSMPTVDPTRYDWDYGQHMQSMNERQQIPIEEEAHASSEDIVELPKLRLTQSAPAANQTGDSETLVRSDSAPAAGERKRPATGEGAKGDANEEKKQENAGSDAAFEGGLDVPSLDAFAWQSMMYGGMPGMMPGMMPPDMIGIPPAVDPATMMYHSAIMYQHSVAMMYQQQAWMTPMMSQNVLPHPPPKHPALGADKIEDIGDFKIENVWKLAKTSSGSRLVQDALEAATDETERLKIAHMMKEHVREAYRCPHANHVIQKCITTMPPVNTGFILAELNEGPGSAGKIARHKFGCRVLQRLIEHCSFEQVQWLVDELLGEAVELSKHAYANFVLQHVLEHAPHEYTTKLVALLTAEVASVAAESNGSAVLQKAMEHANVAAKVELSHALILQPKLLAAMACTRHGHLTVRKALEVADVAQRNQALSDLKPYDSELKGSRYGRVLFRYLEELAEKKREEQDLTPAAA